MKKFVLTLYLLQVLVAQKYITRNGSVSFFSETPIEDIRALNKQTSCVLDINTGSFAFQVPIRGFMFKNALMQEHFNENYMESHDFPKATFRGGIENWLDFKLSKQSQDISVKGALTIHGVSKKISVSGTIRQDRDQIKGVAFFDISPSDYNIKIPRVVRDKIAKTIQISVNVKLEER